MSFAITPESTLACSCALSPPPGPNAITGPVARVPGKDEGIFEGTVINSQLKAALFDAKAGDLISADLDQDSPYMLVTFNVSRSYAGQQGKSVELKTGMGGGDCGYPFEAGKQYLVYAWKDQSGELSTGICSGTGLLEDRKADIASLRGEPVTSALPEPPVSPPPTRLCGQILKSGHASSTENRVLLMSVGNNSPVPSDEAEVKDDGSFCATDVPPGEYYLLYVGGFDESPSSFGFFPGVTTLSEAKSVALKSGQQIENVLLNVPYQPSYSVSGSVQAFDKSYADLQPKVALLRAEQIYLGLNYRQDVAPDGSFKFPNVLPGKYWAIVMVASDSNAKWITTKVEVDVDDNMSGVSLTLTQK